MVTTVGIRDFKVHLSEYIRQVKKGQSIVITEHVKPVGRILPVEMSLEERVETLRKAGLVEWSGKKLRDIKPPAINRGDKLATDTCTPFGPGARRGETACCTPALAGGARECRCKHR